jgi:hypothetical protein
MKTNVAPLSFLRFGSALIPTIDGVKEKCNRAFIIPVHFGHIYSIHINSRMVHRQEGKRWHLLLTVELRRGKYSSSTSPRCRLRYSMVGATAKPHWDLCGQFTTHDFGKSFAYKHRQCKKYRKIGKNTCIYSTSQTWNDNTCLNSQYRRFVSNI